MKIISWHFFFAFFLFNTQLARADSSPTKEVTCKSDLMTPSDPSADAKVWKLVEGSCKTKAKSVEGIQTDKYGNQINYDYCCEWECAADSKKDPKTKEAKQKCLEERKINIAERLRSKVDHKILGRITDRVQRQHEQAWAEAFDASGSDTKKTCSSLVGEDSNDLEAYDFDSESSPKSYVAASWDWVEDIPRRIVVTPNSCKGKEDVKVCTGYVVCKSKNSETTPSFIRQSTCSERNCTADKAAACTREGGYGSTRPEDLDKQFINTKVKKAILEKANAQ